MLEAALSAAGNGWRIFPCHNPLTLDDKVACSCQKGFACGKPGKHPRITDWAERASSDLTAIREWWQRWPSSNIGFATGAANGIDVLDEDPKDGGEESLTALEELHGPLPASWRSRTGSGGLHVFFRHPRNVKLKNNNHSKIAKGIDFRTDGGQVILPPSAHFSGNFYRWEATEDLADLPWWIVQIVRDDPPTVRTPRVTRDEWFALAGKSVAGDRHNAIARVAGLLLNKIESPHLAISLIHGFNLECCEPPKSREEVDSIIRHIIHHKLKS